MLHRAWVQWCSERWEDFSSGGSITSQMWKTRRRNTSHHFFFFFFPDNGGRAKISVLILYSSSLPYNHPYSQIYYRKHPYPLTFSRKEKFPVKHSASCYMRSHSPHAYFARNSFGTYLCRADSDLFVPACLCLGYKPWLKNIWKYTSPFPFKYGALKASEVVGKLTAKKMGS